MNHVQLLIDAELLVKVGGLAIGDAVHGTIEIRVVQG